MPIFPSNPNNNDEHTLGSRKFKFDSAKGLWKLFDASSAVVTGGSSTTLATAIDHKTYTATSGQTTFAVTYSGDDVIVSRNGIKLTPDEYTASNGTSVVLSVGCNADDAVDCVGFTTAEAGGASVTVSDTTPVSPSEGDMWFNSSTATTFVYYGTSWISVAGPNAGGGSSSSVGSSVTEYANFAAFPSIDNTVGDFGFAQDTKALYVWDGTEWNRVYSGPNNSPLWTTEPPSTLSLNIGDPAATVTVEAADPEGFPITYDVSVNPSNQTQATIVNNNDGTFTFTPDTDESNSGEFTARFTASDGLSVVSAYSTISVVSIPQMANLIGWFDFRDSNSYPGTGTTLYDLSGNGNDMTHASLTNGTFNNGTGLGGATSMGFSTNTNLYFNTNIANNVNTIVLILGRSTDTGDNATILWGTNGYLGVLDSANATLDIGWQYSYGTQYVNGTVVTTRGASWNAMSPTEFNSHAITGIGNNNSTLTVLNQYSGNYSSTYEVQGVLFWDVELTKAEIQQVHNKFDAMATWNV